MQFQIDKRTMLPHQREFWELPNFIKLLVGGYGCGKTHIGAIRSIWNSYINSPVPHLSISPTYKQARKTVIISISELLDRAAIRYTYNKTNHEFHIRNWNGRIWIASGEEPDSLKGPNLGSVGIDEPFIQKKEVFDIALSRLRHPAARMRELYMTGTPEQLNWGYDVAQNPTGKYDLGMVTGRTASNTHLPRQFVDMLYSAYDDNQKAAYMNGMFVNLTAGRVYRSFERTRHLTGRQGPGTAPGPATIMAGIDFNVDHLTAVIFTLAGNTLHFFDEIVLKDAGTWDLAEQLHRKYPGITLFPDPSGRIRRTSAKGTDFSILREQGFMLEARPQPPPVKDRINAVNALLRQGKLTIEGCPALVRDFEQVTWRHGAIDKTTNPELTHASDAAGYAIEKLFPLKLPDRAYEQPRHWRA